MDIVEIVKSRNARILDTVGRLSRTNPLLPEGKWRLLEELGEHIHAQNQVEDKYVLPVLMAQPDTRIAALSSRRRRSVTQELVEELLNSAPEADEYSAKLEELERRVSEQVEAEEREVLEPVQRFMSERTEL